jgi:hypothetical protein
MGGTLGKGGDQRLDGAKVVPGRRAALRALI